MRKPIVLASLLFCFALAKSQCPTPTISIASPPLTCIDALVNLQANASGGHAPYTYEWEPSNKTTASIIVSDSAVVTYTCTVTNSCGSSKADTVKLIPDNPILNVCCNATINSGDSVALTAMGDCRWHWWVPVSSLNCDTCATVIAEPQTTTTYTITGTDSLGCQIEETVTVTVLPTGIEKIQSDNLLAIFPNPNTGIFTIEATGINNKAIIEVYNMFGQKVYQGNMNPSTITQINLSNEPAGLYLYRVNTEQGALISSGKVIIQ